MKCLLELPKEIISSIIDQFIDKKHKTLIISLTSTKLSKLVIKKFFPESILEEIS